MNKGVKTFIEKYKMFSSVNTQSIYGYISKLSP